MKTMFYIWSLLFVACSFASENVIDEITVLSNKLSIVSENETCYLKYNSEKVSLIPKPPCYFLRDTNKKPQKYSYNDVKIEAVLIVTGSPISKEIREEWGLPEKLVCGIESQGVLIKNKKIAVTKAVLKGGVLCKDKGSDEKNYWYFAHNE